MNDKYLGAFLGCALGDTLGIPVEGWKPAQIVKYVPGGRITEPIAPFYVRDEKGTVVERDEFGPLKYWCAGLKKGEWSDDTILPIAVGNAIAEKELNLNYVAELQLKAALSPDGTIRDAGFGGTTRDAFKRLQAGFSPLDSGVIGGPGNGPVTKMFPVGIYMHKTNRYEAGLDFAEKVARITHLDPRSVAAGIVQAHATYALLSGTSRDDFVNSCAKLCERVEQPLTDNFSRPEKGNLKDKLQWIRKNKDADVSSALSTLRASSLVTESYPFALFMFQKYWDNPIEGMLETVNSGGDCDSTGAVFGTLAGALYGDVFPKEWTDTLKNKNKLTEVAKKF